MACGEVKHQKSELPAVRLQPEHTVTHAAHGVKRQTEAADGSCLLWYVEVCLASCL